MHTLAIIGLTIVGWHVFVRVVNGIWKRVGPDSFLNSLNKVYKRLTKGLENNDKVLTPQGE